MLFRSWKEAWESYGVENGGALFRDLARYGIRPPKGWDLASEVSEHGTHQFMLALYQWSFGTAFHAWIPNEQDMDWLSRKYPDTFDRYYRPRWEHIKKMAASGTPYANYRSEEHTSELQSLMRISYAVFCFKK